MIGGGRTMGAALMAGSIVLLVAFLVWASAAVPTGDGKALAVVLALLVLSPVFGVGFYVFRRGTVEKAEFAVVEQEKKILSEIMSLLSV